MSNRLATDPDFHERTVQFLIAAVADGRVPRAQYEAVMIDEGHDFEADWLGLAVGMVDPKSNHFLLLYDDAQSIYSTRRTLGFSLKSAGVEAVGRTKVLRINYRNTREILELASRFAQDWLADGEVPAGAASDERQPWEMIPFGGGRHGSRPEIRVLPDGTAEAEHVARHVRARHEAGVAWADIAVLYRAPWHGTLLERALLAAGVPVYRVKTSADKRRLVDHRAVAQDDDHPRCEGSRVSERRGGRRRRDAGSARGGTDAGGEAALHRHDARDGRVAGHGPIAARPSWIAWPRSEPRHRLPHPLRLVRMSPSFAIG